ncbi:hypothetical protein A8924_6220 [Saccharopolyspora erythraea NRRL 2338]|uniref:Possible conserved transmembrane alanine rich protein n=2 Tax=Saccharopolyspora erythraea TaxID=1836 RepID=A4FLY5_SACEN|nr:hypothetical protein [Saccharopolyspora erythraea]EQD88205.1 hypothetical protein N599_00445 [Saccharopolyspora erythraea D]PFG98698.1 hypothetical protein A8924_6220 [Saccharopolyspora erythraea NRRL 2338]QRK88712.1 hypothetical protein JQX30_29440 [Saccharopolyspora erythraea]CAM05060.1 possible conserved transmembrane alanine rich protein [Saccharopolyspora erythraea NRRL 2338]
MGSGAKPSRQELAQWGEAAMEQLRGPVLTNVRRKIAQWRDPRARLLRQRRRAKRTTVGSAVTTGVLGAGSYASFAMDAMWAAAGSLGEVAQQGAVFGLGGLAVASGAATVGAGLKYRRLKRTPLPEAAPDPVELPPAGSQAREPMRRLRDAEQSLHGALAQLTATGTGSEAVDARATADQTATALRQVAARLQAVEAAIQHAPASDRPALEDDVRKLRAELDEGIDTYCGLVAAAGRAVAASGAPEQKYLIQDATDRLVGLAAALQELSGAGPRAEDPASRLDGPTSRVDDSAPRVETDVAEPRRTRRQEPGQYS